MTTAATGCKADTREPDSASPDSTSSVPDDSYNPPSTDTLAEVVGEMSLIGENESVLGDIGARSNVGGGVTEVQYGADARQPYPIYYKFAYILNGTVEGIKYVSYFDNASGPKDEFARYAASLKQKAGPPLSTESAGPDNPEASLVLYASDDQTGLIVKNINNTFMYTIISKNLVGLQGFDTSVMISDT